VAALYGELGAYDSEGIFIADGSYLFVPDNKNYEGSMRLLFDEHNHPVGKDQERQMTKTQRDRCRWRRCYKAVFLLHADAAGERFVVVGVRVLRGTDSEATALWPLVDTFVASVGRGVMKVLLLDRGFINGPQIGRLKRDYGIDTVIPIRADMRRRRAGPLSALSSLGRVPIDAPSLPGPFAATAPAASHGREARAEAEEDRGCPAGQAERGTAA